MGKKEKIENTKCPHSTSVRASIKGDFVTVCSEGGKKNQSEGLSGRWNLVDCPARIPKI